MSDEIRFGISELADAARVSVRTVRYYITEGLLPPPVTAGAKSYYTIDHRDRLIVIGRLKDAYLPLREIRRQLAEMDSAAIHEMAEVVDSAEEVRLDEDTDHAVLPESSLYGAFDGSLTVPSSPPARRSEYPPASRVRAIGSGDSASDYINRVLKQTPDTRAPRSRPAPPPASPRIGEAPPAHYSTAAEPANWRRIVISDDAELLVREEAFVRRRDKITWLVDWAKKVLG